MIVFLFLFTAFLIPGVISLRGELSKRQGFYYSFWSEGNGNFKCTNAAGGKFDCTWSGKGGFVAGKGWNPGSARTIKYAARYEPKGPGYLAIYGWTRNPLIEYYVIEAHGDLAANEPWTPKGNFTSEEGTYEVFTSTRVNKPSIEGTRTFQQYWSVRTEQRTSGTVDMKRHFDEWRKLGMRLGSHNYQLVAVESFTNGNNVGSGQASVTVQ